jgi:hypothetical protein
MLARFLILLLADLLANLLGYLLNPIVVLFGDAAGALPRALAWFATPDATLDGMGADGKIEPRFLAATESWRGADLLPKSRWHRYLCRVCWLYRNNVNGFSTAVTGAPGPFWLLSRDLQGSEPADRYPAASGRDYAVWRGSDGRSYFSYRYVQDRGNGKCFEAYVGWKISETAPRAMLVCRWTPIREFESTPPA